MQKLAETNLQYPLSCDDNEATIRILAEQAHRVVLSLEAPGLETAPACAVPSKQRTIWHGHLAQIELPAAQRLHDAGFRDVDEEGSKGDTPLLTFTVQHGGCPARNLDLWEWFYDHCGDLFRRFPTCDGMYESTRPRKT